MMYLYNTLTRKIEKFVPLNPPKVTLYTCGPTVYDYPHIGNIRSFTNNDFLKRTLIYFGYQVTHVMNITDVGHLTGDNDSGEDKLEKGARSTGKTVWDVARYYTDYFFSVLKKMNILPADFFPKATEHIKEIIDLIKKLEDKGYVYQTPEALYFDVSRFKTYGQLSSQKISEKISGAREEVYIDPHKKNPADFALWFKKVGRFKNHQMHWPSPWGDGFPGWHIECSVMSMKYLGSTIDIHAGGIDHIPIHHENEIAQSEAASGQKFVRFWFHNQFLLVDNQKMSKSLGNYYTLDDLQKKGIEPMALRLLFLQSHYRQIMNFTWQSVKAAQEAYNNLKNFVLTLKKQKERTSLSQEKMAKINNFLSQFEEALGNDLQTPKALAVMWSMIKSNIPSTDKLDLLFTFDRVFGLRLNEITEEEIPETVINLAKEREKARKTADFKKADRLREKINQLGYRVEDSNQGYIIKKNN
ncbi:MAG: cysteine--tRNA ligase [Microgenomates group bacterium]|nr:cysteine--tRNA ligase [Microgenomates group bacterium]